MFINFKLLFNKGSIFGERTQTHLILHARKENKKKYVAFTDLKKKKEAK